jgi:tricarballylate dehydrogenase
VNSSAFNYDVLVVGGGNAGLCAAIEARDAGASVLLVESAPRAMRGGNSRHTRNLRVVHAQPTGVLTKSYLEEEYWRDLLLVTDGQTDEQLARCVIRGTQQALPFMSRNDVLFQPALSGTLSLSRTNAFFLGGGKALVNAYYERCERLKIDVAYDTEITALLIDGVEVRRIEMSCQAGPMSVAAKSVVVACGGYQANLAWLESAWGERARRFRVRGTPYATGRVLRNLLDQGVASVGDPMQCHAVAVDARAPQFDGGIVTRIDCIPFSVVVNREGLRFYDEGEDVWPKRYAIWGRLVALQPDQTAYAIIDSKSEKLFMPTAFRPITAESIEGLAAQLAIPEQALVRTIGTYNRAVREGRFASTELDDCRTEGLVPPKSHWARAIDTPPYSAYPLSPGITFTYLGVKVDVQGRVYLASGRPMANLFACGEIMAGSILGKGYLAGFGMAIGTVFGRIAGSQAAQHALA